MQPSSQAARWNAGFLAGSPLQTEPGASASAPLESQCRSCGIRRDRPRARPTSTGPATRTSRLLGRSSWCNLHPSPTPSHLEAPPNNRRARSLRFVARHCPACRTTRMRSAGRIPPARCTASDRGPPRTVRSIDPNHNWRSRARPPVPTVASCVSRRARHIPIRLPTAGGRRARSSTRAIWRRPPRRSSSRRRPDRRRSDRSADRELWANANRTSDRQHKLCHARKRRTARA